MRTEYWHERWKNNEIAFHGSEANPHLRAHFKNLKLTPEDRVFVPLCGKTLDIAWLLDKGQTVVGVELVETAVEQLFEELGIEPEIELAGELKRFRGPDIEIFTGDVFDLSADLLGATDAVYDRGALVALPGETRPRYAEHVARITGGAPQLLLTFEYDQDRMPGPPFSISGRDVRRYYSSYHEPVLLRSEEMPDGLKGLRGARANAWLLTTTNSRSRSN